MGGPSSICGGGLQNIATAAYGDYMYKCPALLAIACLARAQDYPKNSFEVGAGAGIPVFARSQIFWDNSAQFSAGYGFRFNRHFQADLMYTRVFNPAERQFEEFVLIEGQGISLAADRLILIYSGGACCCSSAAGCCYRSGQARSMTDSTLLD
jgi:hypothetical protein